MIFRRHFLAIAASSVLCALPAIAAEPEFPVKPVQLVVPFAAGGSLDAIARAVAVKLGEVLGQSVIVDNRPGAGTMIGTRRVRAAPADGYNVLFTSSSLLLNSFAYKNPGYTMKDFTPVGVVGSNPFTLVAHRDVPAKTLPALVAYASSNPGSLNIVSLGPASVTNLCYERFRHVSQLSAVSINYSGAAPALQALMGGTVQLSMAGVDAVALAQSPQVRLLGVTSRGRWSQLPDVPTFAEQGFPQLNCVSWSAGFVSANTPPAVVAKLRQAFAKVMADQGMRDRLNKMGLDPWTEPQEAFDAYLRNEAKAWQQDIQRAGLSLE